MAQMKALLQTLMKEFPDKIKNFKGGVQREMHIYSEPLRGTAFNWIATIEVG